MAELGPDLEDGESYLPSGMLLGEEGWVGRRVMPHRRQVPQRQSFFSDGVAGLPCYPPDFSPFSSEPLPPPPATARGNRLPPAQSLKPIAGFSASLSHFQGLDMSCVYSALVPEATSRYRSRGSGAPPAMGRLLLASATGAHTVGGDFAYPVKSGGCPPVRDSALGEGCVRMIMPEGRGPFLPAKAGGKGQIHGGTGVFLPLPRLQGDWRRMPRATGDGKWALPKQDNKSAAVPKQGKLRSEMGLPPDWTY